MSDQRFGLVAGRYLLRDQLGHGGMGRVWLARDEMLDRDVAIKEVAPPTTLSPEDGEQLRALILREARAAARINHPHVVKIYDVLQTERWPWIVMEYIPSESLQRHVQFEGPLPAPQVATIGLALLDALVAAHDAGVLHRDIKPDNVLLADDGRVVLTDFGLASVDTDGTATRTGQLGTPQYVAPERARHGTSSAEADMWSLGATLYAAVEGRSPYGRESVLETLTALAVDPPDPMRLAGPLAPVLSGLLQRDPAFRTHPDKLAEQLRTVAAGQTVATGPSPAPLGPAPTPTAPTTHPALSARVSMRTVAAGVTALGLTVLVGLILTAGDRGGDGATPPSTEPSTGPPVAGVAACETMPARTEPIMAGQPGPPGQIYALPDKWTWFSQPEGDFWLGVPEYWRQWRSGDTLCFKDPGGSRVALGFVPGELAMTSLPGYTPISRKDVVFKGPAVELEFTYDGPERTRHVLAEQGQGHTLFWIGDDFDFSAGLSVFQTIRVSFEVKRGPGDGRPPPGPSRTPVQG